MSKAVFMAAVPPFLLKTPDNPGGVDGSVFDGIKRAIAADRLAFLSRFHGDADRILPIAATGIRTQEAVKGARLVVVEGGPHGLNWTHAETVNRELLDFLGQRDESAQKPTRARAS